VAEEKPAVPDVEFVVYPEGELDIATIPALREEWLALVDDVQPELLVIDLTAVTFLDSTALAAVIAVHKRQREHGGRLIVSNANPRLAKIFEMTGLRDLIDVRPQDGQPEGHPDGHADGYAS
jgi:anti-sigma B factor antagonist